MSSTASAIAAASAATIAATAQSEQQSRDPKAVGISYVVLFLAGIFANFFVREGLIDNGDASLTASNISESQTLFRFGIVTFLLIFALDVLVAWALHIVMRERHHDLSLLAAWLRLTYTVMLGVAIIFFFQALSLLSGADALAVIPTDQLQAQALVALELFNATWLIGLAAFGLHLAAAGWLLIRTQMAPPMLGVVLMVAGAAYVADTVAYSLLSNYGDYESLFVAMVAIPAVIAEAWFGLWLLLRAGRPTIEG